MASVQMESTDFDSCMKDADKSGGWYLKDGIFQRRYPIMERNYWARFCEVS